MQLIDTLLGFAVLTSPLWLIFVLLPVAIWIAVKIAKRFTNQTTKIAVGVGVFLFVFFTPFADGIAGRLYFNHLCATKAGVKVYQTVELPGEYWDENGQPNFFNRQGYIERSFAVDRVDESGRKVERYSLIFGIDKSQSSVIDKRNRILLGEITTFRHWGGWVRRNFSAHNTATSCPFIHDPNFSRDFYSKLFKPSRSSK